MKLKSPKRLKSLIGLVFIMVLTCLQVKAASLKTMMPSTPMNNIAKSNEYFTGREDILEQITKMFMKGDHTVVVSGFLGTGKTQIVRKYAELNVKNYDIIWFLDAKKPIEDQYRIFASHINEKNLLDKDHKINVDAQSQVILNRINEFLKTTSQKWLVIFDNVQSRGEILNYLPPQNDHAKGYVLITTRSEVGWKNPIKVGKFKRIESLHLLEKVSQIQDVKQLEALASVLYDHPLSLTQAASFIRKYLVSNTEDYINLFLNRRKELWEKEDAIFEKDQDVKDLHDNYEMTAGTAFRLSLEKLKNQSPLGLKLLFMVSFWHNNRIPEDILYDLAKELGIATTLDFNDVINDTIKLALLEKDRISLEGETEENTYNMHDLVPIVLQDMQSEEEKKSAIKSSLKAYIKFLEGGWDKLTQILAKRPHLIPHIESICKQAEGLKIYENDLIVLKTYLLQYHVYHTRDQETYESLVKNIEKLIEKVPYIEKQTLARFYVDRLYSRSIYEEGNEAYCEKTATDFETAISYFNQTPGQIDELFKAYTNFAQYWVFLGDFEKSIATLSKAEALIEKVKSESYKNFFYYIKAWILSEKGDFKAARKAIDFGIKNIEKEKSVVLQIYIKSMKCWVDFKVGDYDTAYKWALETEEEAQNFFDTENNDLIAWVELTIGLCEEQKGNYKKAEAALKRSIKKLDQNFGGTTKHNDQAYAHMLLGNIYVAKGQLVKAKNEYQFAEKTYELLLAKKEGMGLSELYTKYAILGAKLKDDLLAKHYLDLHAKYFKENQNERKEILQAFKENNLKVIPLPAQD